MIKALPALIIFLCITISKLYAQHELYNAGGLLHANKDALLYVDGEIENNIGSTIENDGVIELNGNITNDSLAIFTTGSDNTSTERACKFIGAGTQLIKGNFSDNTSRYFYNLIIDKSASGTAVQLQTSVNLKGSLLFGSTTTGSATYTPTGASTLTNHANQGIIKTFDNSNNDYELYLTNSSANAVAGYAPLEINGNPSDRYIQNRGVQGLGIGGFARNVSTTNAAYVFPVGSITNGYNASSLTFTSLGINPDKVRTMFVNAEGGVGSLKSYCQGCEGTDHSSTGFNYHFPSNSCNVNNTAWIALNALPNKHGYWSYSGNSSDQYFIETYPNSFSGLGGSESETWRMIKKAGVISDVPSGDWTDEISSSVSSVNDFLTYTKNTGCYMGNGIPGGLYTGFSHFQMARGSTGQVLPVDLISLSAKPVENKLIRLDWVTALEFNNRGFKILRSTDGDNFEQVGWIKSTADGNSTVKSYYSFDDTKAISNVIYYYRLNQVDFDGSSKDTRVVDATLTAGNAFIISPFFPNPAKSTARYTIQSSSNRKLLLELYNINGQMVIGSVINTTASISEFELDTSDLPPGNYKAVFKSDEKIFINPLHIIY